jgi:hypothetical protein
MSISMILNNKPPFYHYTNPGSLIKILESRALLAMPISKFKDQHEYVLGLNIIRSKLKYIAAQGKELELVTPSLRLVLQSYPVNFRRVFEETISHIEHEIANRDSPRVEIYVACVSATPPSLTEPHAQKMLQEYGRCILKFNWLLPLLAYAWPQQFVGSMISRVAYDDALFNAYIPMMGFDLPNHVDIDYLRRIWEPVDGLAREASLAAAFAVLLCSFAANIKNKKYAYEAEWRLKSFKTNHLVPLPFKNEIPWIRVAAGMKPQAEFNDMDPRRYVQELSFDGKIALEKPLGMIVAPTPEGIDSVNKLAREIIETQKVHGPIMGPKPGLREGLLEVEAKLLSELKKRSSA